MEEICNGVSEEIEPSHRAKSGTIGGVRLHKRWQCDVKDTPFALHTLCPNPPAVFFHHGLTDGKAQARAFDVGCFVVVDAVEFVEDEGQVSGGDANAIILDTQQHSAVLQPYRQVDLTPIGGIFDSIACQVTDDLAQSQVIAQYPRCLCGAVVDELLTFPIGGIFELFDYVFNYGRHIAGYHLHIQAGLYPADVQQIIYELGDLVNPPHYPLDKGVLAFIKRADTLQHLGIAQNGGQGRAEIVGDGGHELCFHMVQLFEVGDILHYHSPTHAWAGGESGI